METGIEIFSPEERNEISDRIEAASARDAIEVPGFPAKKQAIKQAVFPILVNAGAFILLILGLFLLISFQQSSVYEIRDSGTILGITERALIREIQKQAQISLNEKEAAIKEMHQRIDNVSLELVRLELLETLTEEQRSTMQELRYQEEYYNSELERLEHERSQIVVEARNRENETRSARSLEQQRNIQNRPDIQSAQEELARLSGEAERTAFMEMVPSDFTPVLPVDNIELSEETALRQQLAQLNSALMERDNLLETLRNQNASLSSQNASYQQTIASYENMIRRNTDAERENQQ